jgi:hypothetical protein
LLAALGRGVAVAHVVGGKTKLDPRLNGYNNAARYAPWVVIRDLDTEECAPVLVQRLLPAPAEFMCFRVAVRAIESWLLADAANLAAYLRVRVGLVPGDPDALPNPKTALVTLANRSTARGIREDMVPRPGSGASIGPNYPARLIEFARDRWNPLAAAGTSPSLNRAIDRIRELAE